MLRFSGLEVEFKMKKCREAVQCEVDISNGGNGW